MELYTFFSYYGGKWSVARRYPPPEYQTLIEPFAGAAGYSLRHPHLEVKLFDLDLTVCGIWEYLIETDSREILTLPLTIPEGGVDRLDIDPRARDLIGFWLGRGQCAPLKNPSSWMKSGKYPRAFWGEVIRDRLARQVEFIRHWRVAEQSYEDLIVGSEAASWFIDPPYQNPCGRKYIENTIDYEHLGRWCQSLPGQVVVCEQEGADWLPFKPLLDVYGTRKRPSKEILWTKEGNTSCGAPPQRIKNGCGSFEMLANQSTGSLNLPE